MNDNPLLKVKRLPRDNSRVRYLTDTELEKFLFFCDETESKYLYPFVIVSITTGLRKRNVLDLEYNQINFKRKEITVLTKNGERHTVPLHPKAEYAIRSLCPEVYYGLDYDDEREAALESRKYVFLNEMTGKPVRTIHVAWHVACERAGIEDFRPHDLRHCFASYMALKGNANLQDIKEALGHKNIQQTMRYTHLTPNHMKELVNRTADKIFDAANYDKH